MRWESVNAMTFESATHRVRRVGNVWLAERKCVDNDPCVKLGSNFRTQIEATDACEADAYRIASGR